MCSQNATKTHNRVWKENARTKKRQSTKQCIKPALIELKIQFSLGSLHILPVIYKDKNVAVPPLSVFPAHSSCNSYCLCFCCLTYSRCSTWTLDHNVYNACGPQRKVAVHTFNMQRLFSQFLVVKNTFRGSFFYSYFWIIHYVTQTDVQVNMF